MGKRMRNRHIFKNFYFYLRENLHLIRNYKTHTRPKERHQFRLTGLRFLKDIGMAAFASTTFFFLIVYMHQGKIDMPSIYRLIELGLVFIFLIFLIWTHRLISILMYRDQWSNTPSLVKPIVEIFLVVTATLLLNYILNYIPLTLMFPPEAFIPSRVRTSFIITIIISLFLYYFVERERSKKRLQAEMLRSAQLQKENFQAQLENLKNQVNPHFLFNSLNVLISLIPQDSERATEFTRKLSEVYRSFLDNSQEQLIPLQKELEVAKSYIYLLETRFGEAVKFKISVPPEKLDHMLPPAALQLLLENATKHNGSTRKKPLYIEVFHEDNKLVVKNNLQPRKERMASTKKGLENIKSRYRYFTDEPVEIEKGQHDFVVKIPLLKESNYEDLNN